MTGLLRACGGLALWALAFSLLYAAHGMGCAWGWTQAPGLAGLSLHRSVLGLLWLLALAAHTALLAHEWRAWRRAPGLLAGAAASGAAVGWAALAITGAPVVLASSCL